MDNSSHHNYNWNNNLWLNKMIYTNSDGGARGNSGPGAIGIIVRDGDKILIRYSQSVGNFLKA